MMACRKALIFSLSFSSEKDNFPTWRMDNGGLIHAELHPSAFDLIYGFFEIEGHCPRFGIRHQAPWGPRIRPSLPTLFIISGVAITTSKSVQPLEIFSISSSPPTKSAPALFCFGDLFSGGNHAHPFGFAGAVRKNNRASRTIWSECLGSTPSRWQYPRIHRTSRS